MSNKADTAGASYAAELLAALPEGENMGALQRAGAACRNAEYELQETHEAVARAARATPRAAQVRQGQLALDRIREACEALSAAAEAFYEAADKG